MSVNYKRTQILIDGPEGGPYEITTNRSEMVDGELTTKVNTVRVLSYSLTYEGK